MSQEFDPRVLPSSSAERRRNRRDIGVLIYSVVAGLIAAAVLAVIILA